MSESIDLEDHSIKEIQKPTAKNTTDLVHVSGNLISNINYKVAFFIFFIGMIVFSDIFIDSILSNFESSVSGECATTKGTFIQLLVMVITYIIVDLLVKYDFL